MEAHKQHSPWYSLMILLGLTLGCAFVTQFLGLIGFVLVTGKADWLFNPEAATGLLESPGFLYSTLLISSVGTFLLPSLILQNMEKRQYRYFPSNTNKIGLYLLLTLIFLVVFNPAMEFISLWNQKMSFPESMKGVETWMLDKEQESSYIIEKVIVTTSPLFLFLNLIVMAIVPAIVEEFYFRGSLQGILTRMFGNIHVAIWVTAIVFSAIHLQFYGFFPRMILGLIFGYSFYWTQNIWVAVFGHFINNAAVTIIAYVLLNEGKTFKEIQTMESYSSIYYILSVLLAIAVGYYFYQVSRKSHEHKQSQLG
ncbi:CPBP family intramembrane glutamic endopeptidase [Sphingobacterium kyonggiense]